VINSVTVRTNMRTEDVFFLIYFGYI